MSATNCLVMKLRSSVFV